MRKPLIALMLASALLAGCGSATPLSSVGGATVQAAAAEPTTKEEFLKAVADRGVKLTADQLEIVRQDRVVEPNGVWAPRPAANLSAAENLRVHFEKHGHEFSPAIPSQEAYLAQAIALAKGERGEIKCYFDTTSFDKGYQSNVVRWNPKTKEMTALRPDGAITTYYRNMSLQASRFVVVPIF